MEINNKHNNKDQLYITESGKSTQLLTADESRYGMKELPPIEQETSSTYYRNNTDEDDNFVYREDTY